MEGFVIETPDEGTRAAAAAEVAGVEGVERHGSMDARGDVAMVSEWVQVVSGSLGAASTAFVLITSVVDRLRRRGIKGTVLRLPNDITVEVDEATPEQLRQVADALGGV